MTRRRILDGVVLAGSVLILLSVAIDVVTIATGHTSSDVVADLALAPVFAVLALIAPAIVRRRPDNAIGLIFAVLVLVTGLALLADAYAVLVADPGSGSRPYDHEAAWVSNWAWAIPAVTLLACELPLRFPDGALPSPRWRWVERLVLVASVAFVLGMAFSSGKLDSYPIDNPVGIEAGPLFHLLLGFGGLLVLIAAVLCLSAIVLRFRRARGLERQQLKLLAVGALGAALALAAIPVFAGGFDIQAGSVTVPIAVACIVLSAALAVLRYRLYDIDRLISRTLSWVVLTAVLGLAYLALVLLGQQLFSSFAGGSGLAIAASTLAIAALFLPLRSRVQRVVDRRFYRRRYDAQRTLDAFGARLREHVELDELRAELCQVVETTVQPASASVWLRGEPS
jgi:heme/copper-type cytochrome/quinol oxidase subunit 3